MTLDEAIKHCEEVAEKNENNAQIWHKQTKGRLVDFCDKAIQAENKCVRCAEEHRQLAEWLKDYKRLLKQESKADVDKARAEIQNYANSFVLAGRSDLASAVSNCITIIDKYRESEE